MLTETSSEAGVPASNFLEALVHLTFRVLASAIDVAALAFDEKRSRINSVSSLLPQGRLHSTMLIVLAKSAVMYPCPAFSELAHSQV